MRAPEAYGAALEAAFEHSEKVLVEAYVELGREVRCAVLEREGELAGLPLEEYAVDPVHRPVRRHADKIGRGDAGDCNCWPRVPKKPGRWTSRTR